MSKILSRSMFKLDLVIVFPLATLPNIVGKFENLKVGSETQPTVN